MSDHALSQEEIDALLRGETPVSEPDLVDLEPLVKVFQAVVDSIAPVVSPVAGYTFEAGRVTAQFVRWDELKGRLITPLVARIDFEGDLQGTQLSIADGSTQQQLKALLDEDPVTTLNKIALAVAAGLEEQLGLQLGPEISSYESLDPESETRVPWGAAQTCAVFNLSLHSQAGHISWQEVLTRELAVDMLSRLGGEALDSNAEEDTDDSPPSVETVPSTPAAPAAFADGPAAPPYAGPVTVAPAHFAPLGGAATGEHTANIGLIMDVPLQVTVELGRKRMLVRDVLELGKGSLIELEKLAGEPVDVFVNGKLVAKGEVVVIDENFGVKVTSIVTPVERLQNLQ